MREDIALGFVKKLAKLFPNQVNQEQAKEMTKHFAGFTEAAVDKAISQHRANPDLKDGFWNMGKLLEGCRAAERGASLQSAQFGRDESLPDIIRRQWDQLRDRNDFEVLLRYWRADWYRYSTDADQRRPADESTPEKKAIKEMWSSQYNGARDRIAAGCKSSLLAAGMELAHLDGWVETVFDPDPAHFQRCLEEVRQMMPPAQKKSYAEMASML